MRRLVIVTAIVALTCGLVSAQKKTTATDWVRVDVCHISFLLPRDLKRTNAEGIDSCVAEFANPNLSLYIDYGWYGGSAQKNEATLDFEEHTISVGGKKAQLALYIDDSLYGRNNPNRKYVAHAYVVVKPPADKSVPMTTTLMMAVHGTSKKEQALALRIMSTVSFR